MLLASKIQMFCITIWLVYLPSMNALQPNLAASKKYLYGNIAIYQRKASPNNTFSPNVIPMRSACTFNAAAFFFLNQCGKGYYFRAMLVSYFVHSLVNSLIFIGFYIVFNLVKK